MTRHLRELVDPFTAVDWPGNGLCGPYLPYSMVRLGPDTLPPVDTTGYASGRPIQWFSHTHVSGTGGTGRYGNIGVLPFVGGLRPFPEAQAPSGEEASPGYYSVHLQPANVKAELTVTPHVGLHRYTFPPGAEANVLLNAGAVIQVGGAEPLSDTGGSLGGFIERISDTEVLGRSDFRGGWGHKFPYSVYFFARFDQSIATHRIGNHAGLFAGPAADGPNCRMVCNFGPTGQVQLQVGISFVSVAKARARLGSEVGRRDFDAVRRHAEAIWEKALGRLRIEGGTADQQKLFYSLFSRLLCLPTDLGVDDENPFWHSGVRAFTDFYALWDSCRNANSLLGLFDPETEAAFLNSLLDVADHIGWVPDAWIAGHSAQIQGGSSADALFCEAALKGIPGVDYHRALECMRRNAETESPNPDQYGRYGEYRRLGFLSTNVKHCCSRHVEYAYQDWCIGNLADHLGQEDVARFYRERSANVWKLWRDDLKSIAPRQPDGRWHAGFDPDYLRPDCWADPFFYEGSGRAWSFGILHDVAGLMRRVGGPAAFVDALDHFLAPTNRHPWKEIVLHLPYLYTYAGRPDLTAARAWTQMSRHYRLSRNGLDDNEDMGCQSAYYMATAMGLYPLMGQDLYLLSTPVFTRVDIALGASGRTLSINAPEAGPQARYITAATLNGRKLDRAWLRHGEIADGGSLHLELGDKPTAWGSGEPPPRS